MQSLKVTGSRRLIVRQMGYRTQARALGGEMGWFSPQLEDTHWAKKWRFVPTLCATLGFTFAFAPQAKATFINTYALSNFTLINTDADGSVMTPDNGVTVVLTGGNNGTGLSGTTDLTIVASAAGQVQFSWSYAACDVLGVCDTPGYDNAGYLLNNVFTQLADAPLTGTTTFTVNAGDTFGFEMGTVDNSGEPGVLNITNFNAPVNGASTPEPGTASTMLGVTALALAGKWWTGRCHRDKGRNA